MLLIPLLAPLGDELAVEDEDVEEGVEEEDDVVFDGHAVEQDGLWGRVERVGHQRWLDHDQRVVDVLLVQDAPQGKSSVDTRMI